MSTTVDLVADTAEGRVLGTATLRDTKDLRGRDRLLLKAAALAASSALAKIPPGLYDEVDGEPDDVRRVRIEAGLAEVNWTFDEAMAMQELRQATVVARLVSWSLKEPLPTMATIGDLPGELYDALVEAAGGGVTPDATDFEAHPDKERPTGGSSDSDGLSTAADETEESTTTPQTDGGSTATESSTPA